MTRLTRRAVVPAAWLIAQAWFASPAGACTCGGYPTIDQVAGQSPVVVVGRVVARGPDAWAGPEWVDVDLEWVVRGEPVAKRMRIWDELSSTDCGGDFRAYRKGHLVVFAGTSARELAPLRRELWGPSNLAPADGDLVIGGGCGEATRRLSTRREQDRWRVRRLK